MTPGAIRWFREIGVSPSDLDGGPAQPNSVFESYLTSRRQQHEISTGIGTRFSPVDDDPTGREIAGVAHHDPGSGHAQPWTERKDNRVADRARVIADPPEARR